MELDLNNSSITDVLLDFGNEVQEAMKENLSKGYGFASGDLYQSINFSSKILGNTFHFVLDMGVDYWKAVDEGRKAGTRPPINDIIKWVKTKAAFPGASRPGKIPIHKIPNIKDRAVQRGLAYVIARKIGDKGTKGNKCYYKVITPDRLKQLQRDLGRAAAGDMQTIIGKTAKGIFGINT